MAAGYDITEEQEVEIARRRTKGDTWNLIAKEMGLNRQVVARAMQRMYRDTEQIEESHKRVQAAWTVVDQILEIIPIEVRDEKTGKLLEVVGPKWSDKLAAAKMVQELAAGRNVGEPEKAQEQTDAQLIAILSRSLTIIEQAKKKVAEENAAGIE